jgi:hypothetical protein
MMKKVPFWRSGSRLQSPSGAGSDVALAMRVAKLCV